MAQVRAAVTRWISSDFPGWVEVVLTDAQGVRHVFRDKVPVFTDRDDITENTPYPSEIWLDCDIDSEAPSQQVTVALRHGVESLAATSTFAVSTQDVVRTAPIGDELQPSLVVLRAAYPNGVPEHDYMALLAVLHDRYSNRQLASLVAAATGREAVIVDNDHALAVSVERPADKKTEAVKRRLFAAGYGELT
jgi:hypothetical protein